MKKLIVYLLCCATLLGTLSFSACSNEAPPNISDPDGGIDNTSDNSEYKIEEEREMITTPINIAPLAHTTAISANKPVACINDGALAEYAGTAWDTWNSQEEYPIACVLTWDIPMMISSVRIMWWADNPHLSAGDNVTFPKSARLEYYDAIENEWYPITDMTNEFGEATDSVGVLWGKDGEAAPYSDRADGYTNGGNRYWNEVTFSEVGTTALRILVDRSGDFKNGIGIGECQVIGKDITAEWDKLMGAAIKGGDKLLVKSTAQLNGKTYPEGLEGAEYKWSVKSGSCVEIDGADNGATVNIKSKKVGPAVIALTVTCGDRQCTVEKEIIVEKIESIERYETSTVAGLAPILPKKVVANGLQFDIPTEEAFGNNGFNFAEEFNSKLVDVKWDYSSFDEKDYAKAGNKFTVNGVVTYGTESFNAYADITVNEKAIVPEANSTVTFENVKLTDEFWLPKQKVNAINSINKGILEIEKRTGGEPNFVNSIKKLNGESYDRFEGFVFQDTDIYKSIEAISYTLSVINEDTDPELVAQREKLEKKLAYWISLIEQVQYADGYINTCFTLRAENPAAGSSETHRFRFMYNHEMYNLGHFYESAVAYTRYQMGTKGLDNADYSLYVVAKRSAQQVVDLFGPGGPRNEVPGHEEIELALVKLAKLAEELEGKGAGDDYIATAKLLVDRRGDSGDVRESGYQGGGYAQDNANVRDIDEAVGHAVRACYFYTGVTDIATLLPEGDPDREAYLKSMDRIWDSVALTKTYITGGIGVATHGEDFGGAYELPNDNSYCETCASIALANWNQRLNLVHEDAKYIDEMERALYNGILVGTNLDGNLFYYDSRLENNGTNTKARSEWFGCACCPPNLMRTIAKLSEYMYTVHSDTLFVNMYIDSEGSINVGGVNVAVNQQTKYPWEGAVKLTVSPKAEKTFTLKLRIPGWVSEQNNKTVSVKVNGKAVDTAVNSGYVTITREWTKGDEIFIDMPMEIRLTEANPNVYTNAGRVAIERGPIVFCMEKAGNAQINEDNSFDPLKLVVARDAQLTASYNPELLNGVVEITGEAGYDTDGDKQSDKTVKIQAVPYYAWNNRGDDGVQGQNCSSKMLVWVNAN